MPFVCFDKIDITLCPSCMADTVGLRFIGIIHLCYSYLFIIMQRSCDKKIWAEWSVYSTNSIFF